MMMGNDNTIPMTSSYVTNSVSWKLALQIYILCEFVFAIIYFKFIFPHANTRTKPADYRDYGRDRHLLLIRILNRMKRTWCRKGEPFAPKFKSFLRTYFLDNPNKSSSYSNQPSDKTNEYQQELLLKDNVDDFMAWGFFGKKTHELVDWEQKEMDKLYGIMEKDYGVIFSKGRIHEIKACLANVDDVEGLWRPLAFYIIFISIHFVTIILLRCCGFRHYKTKTGLKYWFRPETGIQQKEKLLPLLFFHGIAPGGVFVYLPMLLFGLCNDGRASFFFQNPPISCTCSFHALTEDETVKGVEEAINQHLNKNTKIIISGHSFGSCQMTWLLHAMPQRIKHMLLIDPVSILICYPDTMQNFMYKQDAIQTLDGAKTHLLASTEVFIQHYLRRRVSWYNSELWLDDVPDDIQVTVCLSGEDTIVNSSAVRCEIEITNEIRKEHKQDSSPAVSHNDRSSQQQSVDLIWWPNDGHGSCLFLPQSWIQLKNKIVEQDRIYGKERISHID